MNGSTRGCTISLTASNWVPFFWFMHKNIVYEPNAFHAKLFILHGTKHNVQKNKYPFSSNTVANPSTLVMWTKVFGAPCLATKFEHLWMHNSRGFHWFRTFIKLLDFRLELYAIDGCDWKLYVTNWNHVTWELCPYLLIQGRMAHYCPRDLWDFRFLTLGMVISHQDLGRAPLRLKEEAMSRCDYSLAWP